MAIEVSMEKKGDNSEGRCLPESGRVSSESARREESNGMGHEASPCLQHSVVNNFKVLTGRTKVQKHGYPFSQWSDSIGTGCVEIRR